MSCGELHATPCNEVLNSVGLLIDGEIDELAHIRSIETHFQECPPCREEMEHERRMHQLLHDLLTRSCHERAPQELHDQIAREIAAMKYEKPSNRQWQKINLALSRL